MNKRNAQANRRAFAPAPDNGDFAIEHYGAFPHAEQTEGFGPGKIARGQALAVVAHFQEQFAVGGIEFDSHARRVGVPDDVGERLLKDAEYRGGPVRVDAGL